MSENKSCLHCSSPRTREHYMYYCLKGYLEAEGYLPDELISSQEFSRRVLKAVEEAYPEEAYDGSGSDWSVPRA